MKIPITSDIQIVYGQPLCRTDDFLETQKRKLLWIRDKIKPYDTPITGGDILEHARSYYTNELNNFIADNMFKSIGVIGNHDLVDNTIKNYNISGVSTIEKLGLLIPLPFDNTVYHYSDDIDVYGFHYNQEFTHKVVDKTKFNIAVWHGMVTEAEICGPKDKNALEMIKEYDEYDLIITGHNHKTIVVEHEGRYLINPGSIFRLKADQIDFEPSIFIFDTDKRSYEQVFIPIEKEAVTRDHIEDREENEALLSEFTTRLQTGEIISINFEENVAETISNSEVEAEVEEEIYNIIGSVR